MEGPWSQLPYSILLSPVCHPPTPPPAAHTIVFLGDATIKLIIVIDRVGKASLPNCWGRVNSSGDGARLPLEETKTKLPPSSGLAMPFSQYCPGAGREPGSFLQEVTHLGCLGELLRTGVSLDGTSVSVQGSGLGNEGNRRLPAAWLCRRTERLIPPPVTHFLLGTVRAWLRKLRHPGRVSQ